ncbi:hypothetical protein J2Z31_005966 [Sinorhizobium kostiense]|uniref:Uncharacterized protein n=1 Tax=Sinorhizobium kostiense TaxID=76747 RepID=A0ABS4R9Q4_9HYPH|nr:hypothetical protein [Sinorhizobium kostiense]
MTDHLMAVVRPWSSTALRTSGLCLPLTFIWLSAADGTVVITPAQLGYLLEGIDGRMPQKAGVRARRDEKIHWHGGSEYDSLPP